MATKRLDDRWCEWCGGSFVPTTRRQRFCNGNCQSASSRKRRGLKKAFVKPSRIAGGGEHPAFLFARAILSVYGSRQAVLYASALCAVQRCCAMTAARTGQRTASQNTETR